MKLRSLFRDIRAQLAADLSSSSYASRAGINPLGDGIPPAASVEGEVRSGAVVPGTAPWPGEDPRRGVPETACGWWVGPIWKLDGETCVCGLGRGHDGPHRCSCGATFEGCGHPPRGEVQR